MRRTAFLFSSLVIATGICLAQEQSIDSSEKQADNSAQQNQAQANADASLRDPDLDNAPDAVKEEILKHTEAQTLKELAVHDSSKGKIYEAVYEGDNVETRLRVDANGAPVSMHIAGLGAPINEAAGARRDDQPEEAAPQPAAQQAQQGQATGPQQATVSDEMRQRIQQQLGDETPLLEVQPKVFYQLNIRQNGNVQQIWADETGKVLREDQQGQNQGQQQQQQPQSGAVQ